MKENIGISVMVGLTAIWLGLGSSAQAQIAVHDGSAAVIIQNDGPTSISTNFTVTSGASVLVVSLYDQNNVSSDTTPSTLAWGSQTLSKAVGENNGRSLYADSDVYYLFNPTSGTNTITATASGGTNYAMAMQVYTLSGVNTGVAPVTYGTNIAFGTNGSVALSSSTPVGAWAALSFSYGFDSASGTFILSTSGKTNYAQVQNTSVTNFEGDDVLMGSVSNLAAGASTISVGNAGGGGVQMAATAVAVFAPGSGNVTPQFSGLSGHTITYGTTSVTLTGTVSTNSNYLPSGTTITVTVDGNAQQTTIDDSTGDFSINYNAASIPVGSYTVTYTSAAATGFNTATNTSTTMTITSTGPIAMHDGSTAVIIQNNGSASISTNFTVTSGASVLVVSLYDQNNVSSDTTPSTLAWGSQTLSKAVGENNGRSLNADSDVYYLFNPTSGTHTITATASGGTNYAMARQVYTLSGVNTGVAPVTYGTNIAFGTNGSVALSSSTPVGAWAALSFSYGFDSASGTFILSTSGKTNYAQVQNTSVTNFEGDDVLMGSVSNLAAGASTISVGNAGGGGVQMALAVAVFAPGSGNVTPQFSGLSGHTITYGTTSVTLTGTVSTNGNYLPSGTTITVTVDGNAQQTTIDDSTGDFSINYNAASISVGTYTVTYTSAAATGFNAATNTSNSMIIDQLAVVLSGSMVFDGSTTVPAADLTVDNLVGHDNLTLSGSVTVASASVGSEAITSFSGLTLGGAAAADYTLSGAGGSVTITSGGSGGGVTNWLGIFQNAGDISGWVYRGGNATNILSFIPGDAPPWGPSTGALEMETPVTTSGIFTAFGINLNGLNLTNCTQLEFDIKVATNQTVWDEFFNACNTLNPLIQYGSSGSPDTANSSFQPPIAASAAYNGWQHMVIPASDFGALTNLNEVQWFDFEMVEDFFQTSGNMVLEFANIEWDSPAAPTATISVNASDTVRTADTRWFGANVGDWDNDFNLTDTPCSLMKPG